MLPVLLTLACNNASKAPAEIAARRTAESAPAGDRVQASLMAAPPAAQASPVRGDGTPAGAGAPVANQVPVPADRKVIRSGVVELEVPELASALARIRTETEKAGGYVTGESQGTDPFNARQGSITCRVPAARLDAALSLFQSLGRVESVNVTAEDITEQYFNLEIRLRNQQQLETRFLALLDTPANKVSDLLEIEREVARVRGEIDELEGRRRFWDSQVGFSTLTVQLHEPRPVIAGDGGGVGNTIATAFRQAGENLVETVAWLIASLGVVVPGGLALAFVVWLWRLVRRRRKVV